jgi:hypothetical protein
MFFYTKSTYYDKDYDDYDCAEVGIRETRSGARDASRLEPLGTCFL